MDNGRINADALYSWVDYSDEEEQVAVKGAVRKTPKKKKPILPLGIRRIEHKQEEVVLTTAAEIEAREHGGDVDDSDSDSGGLFVEDGSPKVDPELESTKDDRVWEHGASKSDNNVRIKNEDGDGDVMDIDQIPEGQFKAPDSPDSKKKTLASSIKKKKAPNGTEEDIISEDLERLLGLFNIQNDAEAGDSAESQLEGHMFLFQFPPVLPPLKSVPVGPRPNLVKPEPDSDVVMLDVPAANGATANIDLTGDGDSAAQKNGAAEENAGRKDTAQVVHGAGFVGNLIVRKSGKVELSWGGKTLELVPGAQANFLSTAVLLEDNDAKPQPGQMAGVAYGMGKVQGSFTLAPTWEEEEDWVVDPEDLVIPEE